MNNLFYLGDQDFYVSQGPKGPVICSTQKGVLFVFFHADSNVCKYCDTAKPEFMQLPHIIGGSKFGLCNLTRFKQLAQ